MADSWYGNLNENFDKELESQAERTKEFEENSFSEMEYGVHQVLIEKAYLNITDNGAKMFEVVYQNKDGDTAQVSTYIGRSDGSSTYKDKKTGEEKTLPGIFDISNLCKVVGLNMQDLKPVSEEVRHFGDEREVLVFKQLIDKKLTIALTGEESLGKDNVTVYVNKKVSKFMDADGNYDGTNFIESWTERINKRPIKPLPASKAKASSEKAAENKKAIDKW